MLDLNDLISKIYLEGSYRFNAANVLGNLDWSPFAEPKKGDASYKTADPAERMRDLTRPQAVMIIDLIEWLQLKVFAGTTAKIIFNDVWEGVGDNVVDFHNDYDPHLPDFLAHLNIYLDESRQDKGGLFQVSVDDGAGDVISSFYPQPFDVVIINQKPGYVHRATPSNSTRRLISFKVAFPDFMKRI